MKRTWLYDQINQVLAAQGSALATNQHLIRKFKDSLLTIPGASIGGSSDAVDADMDGVDRWSTNADLVFAEPPGNPRSWFVVTFAGMGGGQLLIDLRYDPYVGSDPMDDPSYLQFALWWSPHGMFAVSGDDGLVDNVTANDSADFSQPLDMVLTNESGDNAVAVLHVVYTDDGTAFHSIWTRWQRSIESYPAGTANAYIGAGVVDNVNPQVSAYFVPPTALTASSSDVYIGGATHIASLSASSTVGRTRVTFSGDGYDPFLAAFTGETLAGAPADGPNYSTGKYGLYPISIRLASGLAGFVGTLSDTFFVGETLADYNYDDGWPFLRYLFENGDKYLRFNHLALPWGDNELHIDDSGAVIITDVYGEVQCPCEDRPIIIAAAPPAVKRRWVYDQVNQIITGSLTSPVLDNVRALVHAMKVSLLAVQGASVRGSSDSATGAMDAVDRWTVPTDLVFADTAGLPAPHSWIVIRFADMDNGELLVACVYIPGDGGVGFNVSWSAGGLFTGGDESSFPTASDQSLPREIRWLGDENPYTAVDRVLHVTHTADGEQARVIVLHQQGFMGSYVAFTLMVGLIDQRPPQATGPNGCMLVSEAFARPFDFGAYSRRKTATLDEATEGVLCVASSRGFGNYDTLDAFRARYPLFGTYLFSAADD